MMPKAYDIITQLKSTLPLYTNYFSDEFSVTSLTRSGTTVTAVTSTPHNLQTDYYVRIIDAITPFTLQSLTRSGNTATGTLIGIITASTISFLDTNPDTILDSGNGFITAGFVAGDSIKVQGSRHNDGSYTIDTVAAGVLTLVGGDSLTAEGAGITVSIVSNEWHDLTENWPVDEPEIEIIGANETDYNGTHSLLLAPNRKTFSYYIDTTPATPATGDIKLLSNLSTGYNGWHKVTVIDPTTFTYEVTTEPESPALGSPIGRTRARISGAVTAERALESYTKQFPDESWGFVVVGNAVANKDRNVYSDATAKFGKGDDYRQEIIQPFSIYVFEPTSVSIAARDERDKMEDLVAPFFKSLLRIKFPTGLTEDPFSGCVFASHGFFDYVGSYYVHEFVFETTAWIVENDTVDFESVAFRDIYINYGSQFDSSDDIIMTDHIDLDDEPLE
jgi:hypothetical protein